MNPAAWCLKNSTTTWVVLVLLAFLGLKTYFDLPRLEDPDFTIRAATITTVFPGASPLKVEQLVTNQLEEKIREMPEIKFVTSQSMTSVSFIIVEIQERFTDMRPIWDKLRNKVDDVIPKLPEGCRRPSVNDEFGDVFGIVLALTGDGYRYRELKDVADDLRDEFLKLKDVAKVEILGEQEERVFVDFSNARGAERGCGPHQLAAALRAQNIVQPGGNVRLGPERVVIEPTGEFKSVDDLRKMSLRLPGASEAIYLEDVAEISRGYVDPPDRFVRYNGQPALALAISMAKGGKVTELGPRVQACLERFKPDLPVGIDFGFISYQPRFVNAAIDEFMENLVEAFVFVFVVVLIFTGARTGLVVGSLVPMAMLLSMVFLPLCKVDLQRVSIASLIIALGMLVDNGVVVSEDILVRLSRGQNRFKACVESARSLAKPLLSASGTTIFAFLPIVTAQTTTGEYTFSLFVVITLALVGSWVLSLTMMPLMCHRFLKPHPVAREYGGILYRVYRRLLLACLHHRLTYLSLVIGASLLAAWGFRYLPQVFFPPNEREMFYLELYQPHGTDLRENAAQVARVEAFLLAQPGVASVGGFLGWAGPRWYLPMELKDHGPHYARLVVNTKALKDVGEVLPATRRFLDREFPDLDFTLRKLELGPPVGAPIQVRLSGPDLATLYHLRDRVLEAMTAVPGTVNQRDDWGAWTKKLVVEVNQEKAKRAGFTSQDIALSLQTQLSGLPVTEYREGKYLIPVVLRSQETYRSDLGRIDGLNVYAAHNGASLPLSQVAEPRLDWQPSNVRRRDGTRTLTVQSDVSGRFASEVMADLKPRLTALTASPDWPAGYGLAYGGELEESGHASEAIIAGLPLAMGLLVMMMVWQFNSVFRPLIILLTVPPMMIGVTFGLMASDAPFGFMAMLGLISLVGVIVNNSIILIDQIEADRTRGNPPADAIVFASQSRLRPIVMTATVTIVGLVPLSLQGGEMWRPMANTLIFGLGFATLLSLILCPVLYSLFFRVPFKGYVWEPERLIREGNE